MKRRMVALSLISLLLLSACGSPKAEQADMTLYEAAGLSGPSETLLTVDGRDVPAWRYLYWLAYDCGQLEDSYAAAGQELDWEAPADGGTTLAEYARRQALSDTVLYATVENWAEQYGVRLSEEEQAALEKKAAAPTAAGAYFDCLPALGLGQAEAQALLSDARLYQRLRILFSTEGSALAPKAEDVTAFAQDSGYLTLDWIFLSAADQDREACRQQAAELFSQLNASSEPLSLFSALAEQYSDDPVRGRTFLPGSGVLPAAVEAAAADLAENQWSGILETDSGFYLLLRKPLDTAGVVDAYFDSLLLSASENAEVTCGEAYEALDVAYFYALFQKIAQAA